jgi:hypothetical protein
VTTMPRDLARKLPANTPVRINDNQVIEGRVKPFRHGMSGRGVFLVMVLLLLVFLFAGFVLSMVQQHA